MQRWLRMLIMSSWRWSLQNLGYRSPSIANEACLMHVASSHLVLKKKKKNRESKLTSQGGKELVMTCLLYTYVRSLNNVMADKQRSA